MSRINSLFLISASAFLLLSACTSNEIGKGKDVNPESIYFDYKVWGDEDNGLITVRLQYRFAGKNGTTLLLEDPSKAEFDGMELKADSSKMNGAYYEVSKPVKDFGGNHSIVFTNVNNKQYKEEFKFQPLMLKTKVPSVVNRGDLVFELDGVEPEDRIRVMLSDTVAFSEGISRFDTVRNGRIVITKEQLSKLADGPVHLELSREDEKKIKNGTPEGGRIAMSYWLRREFELKP